MKYNLDNLNSKDPKTKYKEQRNLIMISESNPKILYSEHDYFINLLNNPNNIMVWTGLIVLGNLARVDKDNKIDEVISIIVSKLNVGKMITAGNAMRSLINIVKAKPEMADYLATEILKSKDYKYDTTECSNIHIGHMFKCIELIWNLLSDNVKEEFILLAKKEINNSRLATSKKANLFLKFTTSK